jgi:hypothetical protein
MDQLARIFDGTAAADIAAVIVGATVGMVSFGAGYFVQRLWRLRRLLSHHN